MDHSMRRGSGRLSLLMTVGVLLIGGIGAPALLAAPARGAVVPCGSASPSCSMTGTLSLTTPSTLGWSHTVTGLDQQLVDFTPADETYSVDDATGAAAGWHVTVSATTFTTGTLSLPNTGTFSANGSLSSIGATGYPSTTCATGSTCTMPTHTTAPTTYPVAITTAASSPATSVIYDADANSGLGSVTIGGSSSDDPVGWWLAVPANAKPGSYTSTISLAVVTAP
jgi:hypothetical protein